MSKFKKLFLILSHLSLAACATLSVPPHQATPAPTAENPPEERASTPAPSVTLASIRPYFTDLMGGAAAKALAENNLADAIIAFDDLAAALQDPAIVDRARFVAAYLSYYNGDPTRALSDLPPLAKKLPQLKPVALEVASLAALVLNAYEDAHNLAAQLPDQPIKATLLGAAARGRGQTDAAIDQYRQVYTRWPDSVQRHEARYWVVNLLVARLEAMDGKSSESEVPTPKDQTLLDALTLIRIMVTEAPENPWTTKAATYENDLLKKAGRPITAILSERPEAERLYEIARKEMAKKRHTAAINKLNRVVRLARKEGTLQCRARYNIALSTSFLRHHEEAMHLFDAAADHCTNLPASRIRAMYKAGKSAMSADLYDDAITHFAQVEKEFPGHRFADDARLHGARCFLAKGDEATFNQMIATLPDLYPEGDMRAEALWIAEKRALDKNDLDTARIVGQKYFDAFPRETDWYTAGRSGYWLGRIMERQNDRSGALRQYEYVVTTAPFTYYMLLAYSRLRDLDKNRLQTLLKELIPGRGQPLMEFPTSLLDEQPTFALGVELVRLGLVSRGSRLVRQVLADGGADPKLHRIAAALFRQLGQYDQSAAVLTAMGQKWKSRYPGGDDFENWTLAYPSAYEPLVLAAAKESQIPPALIWAVMREESGFNERVESWANAIGLMQLILPTARSMAKRLNIRATRKTLKKPEINIRLGSAYLGYLKGLVGDHPALMISGYNAGGGSVGRWRKERPTEPLDMYVENIPYTQTRGYTKRVLASFGVYTFLYGKDQPIPALPFALP